MNLRTLYAKGMAEALSMSATELYDWERAIKEDGQFTGTRSGPGGGTPATPGNVALVLLAILGSPTKRNAGRRAKVFGIGARYVAPGYKSNDLNHNETCPLTGQNTIDDVLTVLLALPNKAKDIDHIDFDADMGVATIWTSFDLEEQSYTRAYRFAFSGADEKEAPPIRTVRILSGKALRAIAEAMGSDDSDDANN